MGRQQRLLVHKTIYCYYYHHLALLYEELKNLSLLMTGIDGPSTSTDSIGERMYESLGTKSSSVFQPVRPSDLP